MHYALGPPSRLMYDEGDVFTHTYNNHMMWSASYEINIILYLPVKCTCISVKTVIYRGSMMRY